MTELAEAFQQGKPVDASAKYILKILASIDIAEGGAAPPKSPDGNAVLLYTPA